MVNASFVLALTLSVFLVLLFRNWVVRIRVPLYLLVALIPVPFLLVIGGWLVREIGRQPWAVYGVVTTEKAVSEVSGSTVFISFVAFTAVLLVLAAIDYWLIARQVRRGPDDTVFGASLESAQETEPPVLSL
ncbi:cytochrome ubiquinol oxidase subunit I [Amycolatopsis sp. cg13]|uniref:cytochrome ubiquinol oxidase subunit I n=1 Tax=Amycolatopsis sp. cg13 TaxID=3238807 RepID=UPI0035250333